MPKSIKVGIKASSDEDKSRVVVKQGDSKISMTKDQARTLATYIQRKCGKSIMFKD